MAEPKFVERLRITRIEASPQAGADPTKQESALLVTGEAVSLDPAAAPTPTGPTNQPVTWRVPPDRAAAAAEFFVVDKCFDVSFSPVPDPA